MGLFLTLIVFWSGALWGGQWAWKRWRQWCRQQPARFVSEIKRADYYRQLSPDQFESLVKHVLKARQYTILDDPYLGRSKRQGYAWKAGKKAVLVHHPESRLAPDELDDVAIRLRAVRADLAWFFYPFPKAPGTNHPDVKILAGKNLLAWFSVLDYVPPLTSNQLAAETCACGQPMQERVNRLGEPMLVCTRYPDCRFVRETPGVGGCTIPSSASAVPLSQRTA